MSDMNDNPKGFGFILMEDINQLYLTAIFF